MKITFFLILFLLSSCSILKNKSVRVYPLVIEDSTILIPVTVNKKTYKFMLDTGANMSSINKDLANSLNLKVTGTIHVAGAQRIFKKVNNYKAKEIEIGGIIFKDIDLPENFLKYAGVIGRDILFKTDSLYLNLKERHFIFNNSMELTEKFPFNIGTSNKIFVNPKINGLQFENFIFDTGGGINSVTYSINRQLKLKKVNTICLEKLCTKKSQVMTEKWLTKVGYNGLIGFSFIKDKIFSIDFKDRVIRF